MSAKLQFDQTFEDRFEGQARARDDRVHGRHRCVHGGKHGIIRRLGSIVRGFDPLELSNASSTCSALSTRGGALAESGGGRWHPAERGLDTNEGTAITSRPCSNAKRAVMSDPLLSDASTMTTPRQSPADNTVAGRKVLFAGSFMVFVLGDHGTARVHDCRRESGMGPGIDVVEAATEHCHRRRARRGIGHTLFPRRQRAPGAPRRRCRRPGR